MDKTKTTETGVTMDLAGNPVYLAEPGKTYFCGPSETVEITVTDDGGAASPPASEDWTTLTVGP